MVCAVCLSIFLWWRRCIILVSRCITSVPSHVIRIAYVKSVLQHTVVSLAAFYLRAFFNHGCLSQPYEKQRQTWWSDKCLYCVDFAWCVTNKQYNCMSGYGANICHIHAKHSWSRISCEIAFCKYVSWEPCRRSSPATMLCWSISNLFMLISKICISDPLWGESTCNRWISPSEGPVMRTERRIMRQSAK